MRKNIWWIVLVATLLCIAVIVAGTVFLINSPLGPRLISIQKITPTSTPVPANFPLSTQPPSDMNECGASGAMTVLVLGESSPLDIPPHGADAIRLMRVDFSNNQVKIVALPPELVVQTPALASASIPSTQAQMVYFAAKQAATGNNHGKMVAATGVMAQTIKDNFAFSPDFYLTISEQTFIDMVDEVNGVDMDLSGDVDGRPDGFELFKAGPQVFTGQQALDFVRILNTSGENSEWERFERQDQVLQAVVTKILQPGSWPRIPALIEKFYQDVATDLSGRQLAELACTLRNPAIKIEQVQVTPEMTRTGPNGEMMPDPAKITALLYTTLGK